VKKPSDAWFIKINNNESVINNGNDILD